MYSQQRGGRAPQTSVSPSVASEPEPRERCPDLKQHYKPVGIGAVTAAALCKPKRVARSGSESVSHSR